MIDAKTLGGMPANPHTVPLALGGTKSSAGLTIRQHFAGLAMQGMLSNDLPPDGVTLEQVTKEVAESAAAYADALLAELAKEP